jgi:hypothetical protein
MREESGFTIAFLKTIQATHGGWNVPSDKDDGTYYLVGLQGDPDDVFPERPSLHELECECPDYKFRKARCKHIVAVQHLLTLAEPLRQDELDSAPSSREYPVQGYPDFLDLPPPAPPWADMLHQLLQGHHRLDEVYDEFRLGMDIPGATTEDLLSEQTFHRFMAGMYKTLRLSSEFLPPVDRGVLDLFYLRHQAVTYELQKRAAPVIE